MSQFQAEVEESKRAPGFWIAGAILQTILLWSLSVYLPVWETCKSHVSWDVVPGATPALIKYVAGNTIEQVVLLANDFGLPGQPRGNTAVESFL